MPLFDQARSLFRNLFSSRRRAAARDLDLDDEIRAHLDMLTDENIWAGMSPDAARRAARLELGGTEQVKEQVRAVRIGRWLHSVAADCRFGLRQLRKNPGFAIVAIITLAAAIGANAIVFTALDAFVLHPLKVPEPETLYGLQFGDGFRGSESYPNYLDFRRRNRSFEDLAVYNMNQAGFNAGDDPIRSWLYEVSGNYFDALKIQPHLGRFFHSSDEHGAGSAPYIVLSYAFWHGRFREDPGVVGRHVELNKRPYTIIGVAPPEFRGTFVLLTPDFYVPLVSFEDAETLNGRGARWIFETIGHLKPGVTPAQAVADLNAIYFDLRKTYPNENGKADISLPPAGLYGDTFGRPIRAFVAALMLLAALILLAACANLGTLFAARAADRSREIAVRLALGSGRLRIVRQLFTEALLTSALGGAVGTLGSTALLRRLTTWNPFPQFPTNVPANPGAIVYLIAVLLAVFSGILFGAAPTRLVLRADPYEIIKSGDRSRLGHRFAFREILLAVQIAICALLVTSSMVAVRGLARSLHSNFGFEPQGVLLASMDLDMAGYSPDSAPPMQKRILDAAQTIPAVTSAAIANCPPLAECGSGRSSIFTDETSDLRASNEVTSAMTYDVSPEFFAVAQASVLAGRVFTWRDDKNLSLVAVVNREFARKVLDRSPVDALGRYFKMWGGKRVQVIGVVQDGKYTSLTEEPQSAVFLPLQQSPSSETVLLVRSEVDPRELSAAVRERIRDLDSGLPVFTQTWPRAMDFFLFGSRMATVALGVLGALGAVLSITGIFGISAYSVSRRRRELGIRRALGAQHAEVLAAALGRPFKVLAIGSIAGLVLGILASRVLASIVYHATPRDPVVLSAVVLAMALLGVLATWIPARRALSIDPAILLREE